MIKEYNYKNIIKLGDNSFIGSISALELVRLWETKTLTYVPDAQRGMKKERNLNTGELTDVPVHFKKNIREIKEAIMTGNYFPDTISINIIKDESSIVRFNNNELYSKGTQALLDGYHRIMALMELSKVREGERAIKYLEFPIKITCCDLETAKRQFFQFTLGSKISASRAAFLNNKSYSAKIAGRLLEDEDSPLRGRINTIANSITTTDKVSVVTFATLTQALDNSFDTKAIVCDKECDQIIAHLKTYFRLLFKSFKGLADTDEAFTLRKEGRLDHNVKCENVMFYGYVAIASYLFGKNISAKDITPLTKISYYKEASWLSDIVRTATKEEEKPDGSVVTLTRYTVLNGISNRRALATNLLKEYKKLTYVGE